MSYSENCGRSPPPPIISILDRNFFLTSVSLIEAIEAATSYSSG
jgi:hypothetical protein